MEDLLLYRKFDILFDDGCSERAFATVRDIEESVFVFMVVVQFAHGPRRLWNDFVDEEEDCFFSGEIDSFSNYPHELCYCDIVWYQIFSLVNIFDVRIFGPLDNHWNSVWVSRPDFLGF